MSQVSRRFSGHFHDVAYPEEIYTGSQQVGRQHVNNLLVALDRCLVSGDQATTAALCSMGLALLDVSRYALSEQGGGLRRSEDDAQFKISSVFNAITELLLDAARTGKLPTDQVRRFLTQLQSHHPTPQGGEIITDALSHVMLQQGDLEGAQRVLLNPMRTRSAHQEARHAERQVLAAAIAYTQWRTAMRPLWAGHASQHASQIASQQPFGSQPLPLSQHNDTDEGGPWGGLIFTHDTRFWAMASRNHSVRDAWRHAEMQLKDALAANKQHTVLSLLLTHIYITAGRWQNALTVSHAALAAAPVDADAAALLALVRAVAAAQPDHGDDAGPTIHQSLITPLPPTCLRSIELPPLTHTSQPVQRDTQQQEQQGQEQQGGVSAVTLAAWLAGVADADPGGGASAADAAAHPSLPLHLATLACDPTSPVALCALLQRAGCALGGGVQAAVEPCCERCLVAAVLGSLQYLDTLRDSTVTHGTTTSTLTQAAWGCVARGIEDLGKQFVQCIHKDGQGQGPVAAGGAATGAGPAAPQPPLAAGAAAPPQAAGVMARLNAGMPEGPLHNEDQQQQGGEEKEEIVSWRFVRDGLRQRAGWWPVTHLHPAVLSSHTHAVDTSVHIVTVAAYMLGPLSETVHTLVRGLRERGDGRDKGGEDGREALHARLDAALALAAECVQAECALAQRDAARLRARKARVAVAQAGGGGDGGAQQDRQAQAQGQNDAQPAQGQAQGQAQAHAHEPAHVQGGREQGPVGGVDVGGLQGQIGQGGVHRRAGGVDLVFPFKRRKAAAQAAPAEPAVQE